MSSRVYVQQPKQYCAKRERVEQDLYRRLMSPYLDFWPAVKYFYVPYHTTFYFFNHE